MGTCTSSPVAPGEVVTIRSFRIIREIGQGGFGRVIAASPMHCKDPKPIYAIKQLRKAVILKKKHVRMVLNERSLLSSLRHPLIANLHHAFQDEHNLYLVMDFCAGGDLHHELQRSPGRALPEMRVLYIAASLICALHYMHANGVMHRDVKPENILQDELGRIRLTDLGISMRLAPGEPCVSTSGTRPYMAPEVFMSGHAHSFVADFFSLGVTLFQLLVGSRPYHAEKNVLRQMVRMAMFVPPRSVEDLARCRRILVTAQDRRATTEELRFAPRMAHVSPECRNFVLMCMICNPNYRLGANGIEELMKHPWLRSVSWSSMAAGRVLPTHRPMVNVLRDSIHVKDEATLPNTLTVCEEENELFREYTYHETSDTTTLTFISTGTEGEELIEVETGTMTSSFHGRTHGGGGGGSGGLAGRSGDHLSVGTHHSTAGSPHGRIPRPQLRTRSQPLGSRVTPLRLDLVEKGLAHESDGEDQSGDEKKEEDKGQEKEDGAEPHHRHETRPTTSAADGGSGVWERKVFAGWDEAPSRSIRLSRRDTDQRGAAQGGGKRASGEEDEGGSRGGGKGGGGAGHWPTFSPVPSGVGAGQSCSKVSVRVSNSTIGGDSQHYEDRTMHSPLRMSSSLSVTPTPSPSKHSRAREYMSSHEA